LSARFAHVTGAPVRRARIAQEGDAVPQVARPDTDRAGASWTSDAA
jgi:hypothetical protein